MVIIIPAYNPDLKLIQLINELRNESDFRILIINDGSRESCYKVLKQAEILGCTILNHQVNKGKGAALKTAFSFVLDEGLEKNGVVCADCDGQHKVNDIINIASHISSHQDFIILGCREFGSDVPKKSLIGNHLTRIIFYILTGIPIKDTQTGLRGFSISMLPWLISLKGDRYEYEMNQLLQAKSKGYEFLSVSIETVYHNQNKTTHFSPILDSVKVYLPILKFGLSSIFCASIDFIALFLIKGLTNQLFVAVVCSRIISSVCNFEINRNVVFQSIDQNHMKLTIKYFSLVFVILIFNYSLMYLFTSLFLMSLLLSKLLTESILFFFNYIFQKAVIFNTNSKEHV